MNVLVTGGAGYIGSVVTEELLSSGHSVYVIDTLEEGHRDAVHKDADFIEAAIEDKEALSDMFDKSGIEACIHMAAYASVPDSVLRPERYYKNNVTNASVLLEKMMEFGIKKMIFSSTAAVYGEPKYTPIDEAHRKRPINPYGDSKLKFEGILKNYHDKKGLNSVSLRYFNACGATGSFGEHHNPEAHLIPLILQVALGKREFIEVFGTDYRTKDGTCMRDYIHVRDLAKAHVLALEKCDALGCRAFNLGNGNGFSVIDVINAAEKVTGKKINRINSPRRPGDPAVLIAGSEGIKTELGWDPEYTELESMIETAWRWHREHPDGYKK